MKTEFIADLNDDVYLASCQEIIVIQPYVCLNYQFKDSADVEEYRRKSEQQYFKSRFAKSLERIANPIVFKDGQLRNTNSNLNIPLKFVVDNVEDWIDQDSLDSAEYAPRKERPTPKSVQFGEQQRSKSKLDMFAKQSSRCSFIGDLLFNQFQKPPEPKSFAFGGHFKEMVLKEQRREAIQKYQPSPNCSLPQLSDFILPHILQSENLTIEIPESSSQKMEKQQFFLKQDCEEQQKETPSSKMTKIALRKFVPSIESNTTLRNYVASKSPACDQIPTPKQMLVQPQTSRSQFKEDYLKRVLKKTASQPQIQTNPRLPIKAMPKQKISPYLAPNDPYRSLRSSPKVSHISSGSQTARHRRGKSEANLKRKKIRFPRISLFA